MKVTVIEAEQVKESVGYPRLYRGVSPRWKGSMWLVFDTTDRMNAICIRTCTGPGGETKGTRCHIDTDDGSVELFNGELKLSNSL